jgi:hypothetical protein
MNSQAALKACWIAATLSSSQLIGSCLEDTCDAPLAQQKLPAGKQMCCQEFLLCRHRLGEARSVVGIEMTAVERDKLRV